LTKTSKLVNAHTTQDILPFPLFRAKALAALSCTPPLLDEDALCIDFTNDGLVCWGSRGTSAGMNAGAPWDARSWEPQGWFLQKYWFLVGGVEDEMWRCAKRWREIRG